MHNLRSSLMGGIAPNTESPLVTSKKRKVTNAEDEQLTAVPVARYETRTVDHREQDRHRLVDERIQIRFDERQLEAELINLSAGGAMIAAQINPNLWDRVDLLFDEANEMEAAVRWIRDGRIGLEFAHETGLNCAPEVRSELLRRVLHCNFPDLAREAEAAAQAVLENGEDGELGDGAQRRSERRHPLVWSGEVLYMHDSHPAKLRNISENGALIETAREFDIGAELFLDLHDAGSVFARVSWSHGCQHGLAFQEPFDLTRLALARPSVTPARPGWNSQPAAAESGPTNGATPWGRLSMGHIRRGARG